MRKSFLKLSKSWTNSSSTFRVGVLTVFFCFVMFGTILLTSSCSTSPTGLATEQKIYTIATNVVAKLSPVAQVAPPPFSTYATDILFVLSAALAGWNTWQQKHINALQNGQAAALSAATPAVLANGGGPAG
jgi:hypothetical protein